MAQTIIQRAFSPVKQHAPSSVSRFVRSLATAALTPVLFSYRSGHFRSSWATSAVSRNGTPMPWYTYPCIDFLKNRLYNGRKVLEFGGGQSSLWWAGRADRVVTLEGDKVWHDKISERMPGNVDLFLVSMADMASCVADVRNVLKNYGRFDVIVVDGLYRAEMMKIAAEVLSADGAIVCDNAEGYGVDQVFKDSDLRRVDFFGYAPGVVNPHCTSMLFGQDCFLLSPAYPIPDPAIAD